MRCSELQCVAVWYSEWQCVARCIAGIYLLVGPPACCIALSVQCIAVPCSVFNCVAVWSSVLHCVALCCSVLQLVAV